MSLSRYTYNLLLGRVTNCHHHRSIPPTPPLINFWEKLQPPALNPTPPIFFFKVFYNGEWGTVCDDSWDKEDAEVVCQELGLGHVEEVKYRADFGIGTGRIWMDDLQCIGKDETVTRLKGGPFTSAWVTLGSGSP